MKNSFVITAWRMFETTLIVSTIALITTLLPIFSAADLGWSVVSQMLASYDYQDALTSFAFGIAAGLVNAFITLLNLYLQQTKDKTP